MLIKYTENVEIESEVDIEFPFYIDHCNLLIKVYSDLCYIELYEEKFENSISYNFTKGTNFKFYSIYVENQNQEVNKLKFQHAILEYKLLIDSSAKI